MATLTAAVDADPRTAPFGVLIQDPWDDGDRQFFWYPTRAALEYALLDAHAFVDPDAFAEDQEEWREPQFDLDAALQEIDELTAADAPTLDEITGDAFGVVWIGHFEDLGLGSDDIARTLRRETRLAAGIDARGGDADAPFTADAEYDALAELLRALT